MRVLSLFDGISCGRVALERAGIQIEKYYASEIDKYAIQITQKNYPDTVQLGDVTKINFEEFIGKVDLLIGGSPCQDLSIAKANREGLNGARSGLFFKYIEALQTIKPKYFLLENNYSMPKEAQEQITKIIGVEPILINSALVSAQLRKRLYWTNIPNISQPEDKRILLKDIIEQGSVDRDKSLCLARRYAGFTGSQSYLCRRYFGKSFGQAVFNGNIEEIKNKWLKNPYFESEEVNIRPLTCVECERLQTLPDNYTAVIPSETARKEAIGNGWTVDVIAHIFKGLKNGD
jgi:DNA (cytosine-5)-methyltransferase 3A